MKAVYSSPLSRANDTASAISSCLPLDFIALLGLRRIDAGEVDRLRYDQIGLVGGTSLKSG
jgi:broad specificity phosphatase PhoE